MLKLQELCSESKNDIKINEFMKTLILKHKITNDLDVNLAIFVIHHWVVFKTNIEDLKIENLIVDTLSSPINIWLPYSLAHRTYDYLKDQVAKVLISEKILNIVQKVEDWSNDIISDELRNLFMDLNTMRQDFIKFQIDPHIIQGFDSKYYINLTNMFKDDTIIYDYYSSSGSE